MLQAPPPHPCPRKESDGLLRASRLKNMAVHELALLVTYYGVTSSTIAEVIALPEDSCVQTLGGFTDFSKVGFTIKTTAGKSITVKADRCGGSCSFASVAVEGEEVFRSMTPDDELKARVDKLQAADPAMMPYFFLQSDDYLTLKSRVINHIAEGKPGGPEGIATIDIAIETLKVSEYLTPLLKAKLGAKVDVVLVGCGCPKRGMGWYHLTQLIEMPNVCMKAVVEPWYLGAGGSAPGAAEFMEMKAEYEAKGVSFYSSIEDMPMATGPTCALIAGRTADNPKLFSQCIDKGVQNIYLEKPGAPSVGALEEMKAVADSKGVKVFLGYNKNVTDYVTKAREFEAKTPGATTTFIHNK